jgi:hypothetical protein
VRSQGRNGYNYDVLNRRHYQKDNDVVDREEDRHELIEFERFVDQEDDTKAFCVSVREEIRGSSGCFAL